MSTPQPRAEIERLENAFWKSIQDRTPDVAVGMLTEPALMISGHGVNKFDHADYTRMANRDKYKLLDYRLADMDVTFPREDVAVATYQAKQIMEMNGERSEMDVVDSSVWLREGDAWRCVMHTESPVQQKSH